MSLEQDLKETFMKHAEDVRPDTQSWPAVEKKVRRAHTQRVVLVSTLAVAAIAAAAVVLPRLGTTTKPHGFVNKSSVPPAPSQPFAIAPVAGKTTYVNAQEGWLIQYPTHWHVSLADPGRTEFTPPGLTTSGPNADVLVASVRLESGDYRTGFVSTSGNQFVQQQTVSLAGMQANEVTVTLQPSGHINDIDYQLDWTGRCSPATAFFITGNLVSTSMCPPSNAPATLIVSLNGTTEKAWSKNRAAALAIASSLRPLATTTGATGPLRTTDGSATSFILDGFGKTLIEFMEARITGSGAETFMCCSAPANYSGLGGLYQLSGNRVIRYTVQYDPTVAGTGSSRQLGAEVTYVGGKTQNELITINTQSDGSTKIAEMCNACGNL